MESTCYKINRITYRIQILRCFSCPIPLFTDSMIPAYPTFAHVIAVKTVFIHYLNSKESWHRNLN